MNFDMRNYRLPRDRIPDARITRLYPVLPRNTDNVPFDIYDYQMLFNDPETVRLICGGNTIGCFYIESPGMRSLLKRLSVESFSMLTAASSVIRPGVAESGMMQEFIARHKDPARRKYLVPEMENILGETYGVMIYQEDVIKVAHHIAGLSLDEADLLRRAMSGKMRSHEAMQRLKQRFFTTASERGLTVPVAAELWRQVESFAGYAFCKAHSASFALLSFQVAFLKAHYPAAFLAGVLSNGGGYYSPAVYIQECKRMGLSVLLPCVNHSLYEYAGTGIVVRIGLMAIKNLAKELAETIVSERNKTGRYKNLEDFIIRVRPGYESAAIMIRCGAMDCFRTTRPTLMRLLDIYFHHRKLLDGDHYDLFSADSIRLEKEIATDREYTVQEKCLIEFEVFGYMITQHPLAFFTAQNNDPAIITSDTMHLHSRKRVQMVGWYMTSKRIRTKTGGIMKFLSLEDLTGTFEAVLFPKTYERYAAQTLTMGPFLVAGRVDMENGQNLIVDKLEVLPVKELSSALQKDSVDHNYYGDVETVTEEDFALASKLDVEKLKKAYVA
jgi:DNA polymerase III alpha subunit